MTDSKQPDAVPATDGTSKSKGRLLFGANVMRGYRVEIQEKSGDVWEGIFTCLNLDEQSSYKFVLGYPKKRLTPGSKDKDDLAVRPEEYKVFDAENVVMVTAKEVRISEQEVSGGDENTGGAGGFETDAAIGKGHASGNAWGRELQKWQPDESEDTDPLWLEQDGGGGGAWDQFAANSQLFGVETTWDEHQYTTKIDRSQCNISEAEAERIAREIESGLGATGNLHIDEERGIKADDSGVGQDEEDKYSSVVRPGVKGQPPPFPTSSAPKGPAWGGKGSGVAAVAGPRASASPPPPPPRQAPPPPPPQDSTKEKPTTTTAAAPTKDPLVPPAPSPAAAATEASSSEAKNGETKDEPAKKFTLNPNAKAFTLNFAAKTYVPGGGGGGGTSAPTPTPAPAPAPAPHPSGGGSRQGHDTFRNPPSYSQRSGGGGGGYESYPVGGGGSYPMGGYGMPPPHVTMDPHGMMVVQGGFHGLGPVPPPPLHPNSGGGMNSPVSGPLMPVYQSQGMIRPGGGMQAIVMTHPPMPYFSGPSPNGPPFYPMMNDGARFGMGPQGYPGEGGQGGYNQGGGGGRRYRGQEYANHNVAPLEGKEHEGQHDGDQFQGSS